MIEEDIIPLNYFHQLRQFIYKRTKDVDATNDILQDVFLKINSGINKLNNKDKITSWTFAIARNAIIDHFREKQRRAVVFEADLISEEIIPDENLNQKVSGCIISFINNLPEEYREALTLSEMKGKSQVEIAKLLGLSYSGAKSRVQRGREKLKKMLMDCCHWEVDCYGNILSYSNKNSCCKPC